MATWSRLAKLLPIAAFGICALQPSAWAQDCGDANADGEITTSDALLILQAGIGLTSCGSCGCDIGCDGNVTSVDSLYALSAATGLANPSCCDPMTMRSFEDSRVDIAFPGTRPGDAVTAATRDRIYLHASSEPLSGPPGRLARLLVLDSFARPVRDWQAFQGTDGWAAWWPAICLTDSGAGALAWTERFETSEPGFYDDLANVWYQPFDATGAAVGETTLAHSETLGRQEYSALSCNGGNAFTMAWRQICSGLEVERRGSGTFRRSWTPPECESGPSYALVGRSITPGQPTGEKQLSGMDPLYVLSSVSGGRLDSDRMVIVSQELVALPDDAGTSLMLVVRVVRNADQEVERTHQFERGWDVQVTCLSERCLVSWEYIGDLWGVFIDVDSKDPTPFLIRQATGSVDEYGGHNLIRVGYEDVGIACVDDDRCAFAYQVINERTVSDYIEITELGYRGRFLRFSDGAVGPEAELAEYSYDDEGWDAPLARAGTGEALMFQQRYTDDGVVLRTRRLGCAAPAP